MEIKRERKTERVGYRKIEKQTEENKETEIERE